MVDKTLGDAEKLIGGGVPALGKSAQGFGQEFMDFLQKYQVIGLAVAFVIGTAATKLVNSTVTDLIMPIIAVVVPGGDWQMATLEIGPLKFLVGDYVGAIIDFVIIALVIFILVKHLMKGDTTKKI
ncbi:MAG: MscL family protein [Methanoregula sp.]|jgi:large conductance mechanosensitive channel|uniref:large conductance mechanosensitive channel protein MscL n=1 Tax=Methanoregula sp. TaxID=2052170 RepID=UPI0025DE7C2A|nr:MscL family protein [Methanoregula sp.]MCK9630359.1 MscL family protein [Methanoregula sp.]